MRQSLAHMALIVSDYDESIAWFTGVLGFTLGEDSPARAGQTLGARRATWHGDNPAFLLLARAAARG